MITKIGDTILSVTFEEGLENHRGDKVLGLSYVKDGFGYIKISKDLDLQKFWEYIEGSTEGSLCSVQKKAVMGLLGLTKDVLGTIITTPARAQEFLLRHELSHIRHHDSENQKLNKAGHLSLYRIGIEARATSEAWSEMLKKYGKI